LIRPCVHGNGALSEEKGGRQQGEAGEAAAHIPALRDRDAVHGDAAGDRSQGMEQSMGRGNTSHRSEMFLLKKRKGLRKETKKACF